MHSKSENITSMAGWLTNKLIEALYESLFKNSQQNSQKKWKVGILSLTQFIYWIKLS